VGRAPLPDGVPWLCCTRGRVFGFGVVPLQSSLAKGAGYQFLDGEYAHVVTREEKSITANRLDTTVGEQCEPMLLHPRDLWAVPLSLSLFAQETVGRYSPPVRGGVQRAAHHLRRSERGARRCRSHAPGLL